MTDALSDFDRTTVTYDGISKTVFRAGSGPGVVVMCEVPGITPKVANFARRLVDAGFTVAMPSLLGTPGKPRTMPYVMRSITGACVSKEFNVWAMGQSSPVVNWLRQLAADLHQECGGPGVGAIGMCLTGGFALAMMTEPAVVAPVLSQPSLPFPIGSARQKTIDISAEDMAVVRDRVANEPCPVLGLRFTNDRMVGPSRFQHLAEELGDGFVAVEIDSSKSNPHGISEMSHSVVTEDLVDEPGHPTQEALGRVLSFFAERLEVA